MTVPDPDKYLLNGDIEDEETVPADALWLTRHLPPGDARRFAFYYVKMRRLFAERGEREFLNGFAAHTGYGCHRNQLRKWVRLLAGLERAEVEATAAQDGNALAVLKAGRAWKDRHWWGVRRREDLPRYTEAAGREKEATPEGRKKSAGEKTCEDTTRE